VLTDTDGRYVIRVYMDAEVTIMSAMKGDRGVFAGMPMTLIIEEEVTEIDLSI
jgi:hypothetical protein